MANLRQLMFNPYVVIRAAPLSRHAADMLSICVYLDLYAIFFQATSCSASS